MTSLSQHYLLLPCWLSLMFHNAKKKTTDDWLHMHKTLHYVNICLLLLTQPPLHIPRAPVTSSRAHLGRVFPRVHLLVCSSSCSTSYPFATPPISVSVSNARPMTHNYTKCLQIHTVHLLHSTSSLFEIKQCMPSNNKHLISELTPNPRTHLPRTFKVETSTLCPSLHKQSPSPPRPCPTSVNSPSPLLPPAPSHPAVATSMLFDPEPST